ncbi:hypothetical protein Aazo_3974 ['Nostoc azollae' 0708]|uniref:Uncharacterized protein n=1 Tax=Nostoc azollae (strain 0708) TaxID=551115 RepID=D7E5A5_NOSA0|nr:hypothetical protein Aazo_3974 ['Nostoc azollae' 0708]
MLLDLLPQQLDILTQDLQLIKLLVRYNFFLIISHTYY